MRWLFVKESLAWPRARGNDVHTYHLMKALANRGEQVALLTHEPAQNQAIAGIDGLLSFNTVECKTSNPSLTRLQKRFVRYWGTPQTLLDSTRRLSYDFDHVVAASVATLPCLKVVENAKRIWYPADDPVSSILSICRYRTKVDFKLCRTALIQSLYMRAFNRCVDEAWVVSAQDAKGLSRFGGLRRVRIVPNGVDSDYYHPLSIKQRPESCVFWGRLDFKPNQDALHWFCSDVWPKLLQKHPTARLTIIGYNPSDDIQKLSGTTISVYPNIPDLRACVATHQVCVLPFVSGTGIKNKCLEAAAMGKAIVATSLACNGLKLQQPAPLVSVDDRDGWVQSISNLWQSIELRQSLEATARQWVIKTHSWDHAADVVLNNSRLRVGAGE